MHRSAYPSLTLLTAWLLLSGSAAAQTTAQQTITVRIPTVLRLRVDASAPSDAQTVDFTIQNGAVTPDSVDVRVFANTSWTLTVDDRGGDGPMPEYRLGTSGDHGWQTPQARPVVDTGDATGDWLNLPLEFRVTPSQAQTVPNGHRTLLFTLTRP